MVNNLKNNQGWLRAGALTFVVMAGLLGACEANEPQANTPVNSDQEAMNNRANSPQEIPDQTASSPSTTMEQTESSEVEEVTDNSSQLIGQTVTVKGEIEEVYSPNLYRLQEQGEMFGDSVLIMNVPPQTPSTLQPEQNVQVTGEVRQLVLADFERDYDLTWDANVRQTLEAEYEGKPVIVARTIQVYQ